LITMFILQLITSYNQKRNDQARSSLESVKQHRFIQIGAHFSLGGSNQAINYTVFNLYRNLSSSQDVHASPVVEVDVIIIVVVIRLLHATRPILRLVRPGLSPFKDGVSLLLHLIEVLESLHLFVDVVQFPLTRVRVLFALAYLFLLRVLLRDLSHHLLVFCVHLLVLLRRFAHLEILGLVVEESLRESLDQALPLTHNLILFLSRPLPGRFCRGRRGRVHRPARRSEEVGRQLGTVHGLRFLDGDGRRVGFCSLLHALGGLRRGLGVRQLFLQLLGLGSMRLADDVRRPDFGLDRHIANETHDLAARRLSGDGRIELEMGQRHP
ncbi:hypothetical protein PENTCL1PPCAC_13692, partial [Pristionchus entomophagus]